MVPKTALVKAWDRLATAGEGGLADAYLTPLSAICLVQSPRIGLILWLVLVQQPRLALVAFAALSGIELIAAWWSRLKADAGITLTDRANGLLSALASTWIFLPADQPFWVTALMIALSVLGGILFSFLARDLAAKSRLPALVWPYCLIAFILFTIFPEASQRSMAYFDWPLLQMGSVLELPGMFLRSMGVFLFSPWPFSGLLIVVALVLWSPAMVLAGMTGWLSGAAVSWLLVSAGAPIYWAAASYNFFLSGAALGAVFFVPDLRGLFFALMAGGFSALVAAALQMLLDYSAVSFLPIPFAMTLYGGLVLLAAPPFGVAGHRIATWSQRPEDNRLRQAWLTARWGAPGTPILGVPLQGALEITQGFDDDLSHRGAWRHALDFQRPLLPVAPDQPRPSIWGDTVFAPVTGHVVARVQTIADNPQGSMNLADNWGNHVILRSDRGDHVLIGHLMQNAVLVEPGQSVNYATVLGRVGNSGRSSVPHLHMQAQQGPDAGMPTQDFRLANFALCASNTLMPLEWHASGRVGRGDIVMAAAPNPDTRAILSGMLPGRSIWTVSTGGAASRPGSVRGPTVIETSLLNSGNYMLRESDRCWMQFALEFDALRLIALKADAKSFLAPLAMCMATIPYSAFAGLGWQDWLPRSHVTAAQRWLSELSPTGEARLDHVVMQCNAASSDQDAPFLIITATPGHHRVGVPLSCELTITPQRGPIQLVIRQPEGTVIYQQMSFEPYER
jgi:hypothetical protein